MLDVDRPPRRCALRLLEARLPLIRNDYLHSYLDSILVIILMLMIFWRPFRYIVALFMNTLQCGGRQWPNPDRTDGWCPVWYTEKDCISWMAVLLAPYYGEIIQLRSILKLFKSQISPLASASEFVTWSLAETKNEERALFASSRSF